MLIVARHTGDSVLRMDTSILTGVAQLFELPVPVGHLRQLFVISIFKYSHASSIDEDVGAAADPLTSGLESGLRVRIEGDLEEV